MRAHRLSLSKLSLAHICSYSFRADTPIVRRPPGRAAQVGSLVHTLAEAIVGQTAYQGDVDPTLLSEAMGIASGPLADYLASEKWTGCEIGFRYDALTDVSKLGPRRGEPGYEDVGASVLPGTIDLVKVDGTKALLVDIKTGKPPRDAEQLYGQAVAVSRHYRLTEVKIAYARALKTKLEILNEEVLVEDRLDEEAGRIGGLLRRLPTAEPNRGDGKHCWFCEARPQCPEWQNDGYFEGPRVGLYDDDVNLFEEVSREAH
jgi:hypothetical protein